MQGSQQDSTMQLLKKAMDGRSSSLDIHPYHQADQHLTIAPQDIDIQNEVKAQINDRLVHVSIGDDEEPSIPDFKYSNATIEHSHSRLYG